VTEDRIDLALQLSEEILAGIETEKINSSSAALRCLRLARLLSDPGSIEWLQYETGGYPTTSDHRIEQRAFEIGCVHGRATYLVGTEGNTIFVELAGELESRIQASLSAMGSLTTQGVSIAGEYSAAAMHGLTQQVRETNAGLQLSITDARRKLGILQGQYYAYALAVNLELRFSGRAEEVFRSYRLDVDRELTALAPDSLKKLDAAYERLSSTQPESWAQALTSCRRVFEDVSNSLFGKTFPGHKGKSVTARSGKALDVSGDHYLNRLYAVVDYLADSGTARRSVGSQITYVVDWIEGIHDALNKGVHGDLAYHEARRAVLHTYVCLGDISLLLGKVSK